MARYVNVQKKRLRKIYTKVGNSKGDWNWGSGYSLMCKVY